MMSLLKRYPFISALGIAAAVLIAVVAFEVASGSAVRSQLASGAPQPASAVQAKVLPPIAALDPEAAYPETGARPLLTPTRRPAPERVASATSTIVPGQFILTGVTIVGPLRIALLREKSSGRVIRVEQGKEVNGMTVAAIEPERVTLALGGDQEVVSLMVTKGAPASAPAPAAASASGPFAAPAAPAPPPGAPATPAGVNPAARAEPPTASTFGPINRFTAPGQPGAGDQPQQQSAPMTPEELLARRRARRTQQNQ